MSRRSVANALSVIKNAIIHGKKEVVIRGQYSKLLMSILEIMKREGYLEDYELISDEKGGEIKVVLSDTLNECKAIMPRFFVKSDEYLEEEKRYLPAVNTGIIIVSTSKGLMTHKEAKGKYGGALIAYVY
ncbi:MAG: 30S ribosomal protein S8 [Candidatus Nanohaloarchaeota archaeon]|nr:30S ribosomal protein S8 [Candidatus Nanohaloarchaeota archaeon]